MSQNIFDAATRNIELIIEIMDLLDVDDCEEIPEKIRELQAHRPTPRAADGAYCACKSSSGSVYGFFCADCGKTLLPAAKAYPLGSLQKGKGYGRKRYYSEHGA